MTYLPNNEGQHKLAFFVQAIYQVLLLTILGVGFE